MSSFIKDAQGNLYRLEDRSHLKRTRIEDLNEVFMGKKVLVNAETGEEVTHTLDLGTHWLMRAENGAYIYTPKEPQTES